MPYRAVLFDLGGVVFDSPFGAIAEVEARHGVPAGSVNGVIARAGSEGAWARNERGELDPVGFEDAFDAELAAADLRMRTGELMAAIHGAFRERPAMLTAIDRIRSEKLRVAAVTNNWVQASGGTLGEDVRSHFDVFIESAVVGLHKPDPRIYELALDALDVTPGDTIFLDDIGRNLKSAAALGITTIKVVSEVQALADLESLLGFGLWSDG
ncbi:MAG: HAD family phosphatase [Acidimicrobiia bacterium]|nr:HAD family phosphatase [Acidimicrobiia bacterium]